MQDRARDDQGLVHLRRVRSRGQALTTGGAKPAPPPTELAAEGLFWRPGSPFRTDLACGHEGTPLRVHGIVISDAGPALDWVLLDVWQADRDGVYSDGLRARLHSSAGGAFAFDTVVPGPYRDEGHMRPAHVHFKVEHPGHAPVTTQLFFSGDPYLYDDPHVRPGLIRPLERRAAGERPDVTCRFDIVLRRIAR